MKTVSANFRCSWGASDAWIESYAATHRLIYVTLPQHQWELAYEDFGLCQLAVISAHHLMEITLAKLLSSVTPVTGKHSHAQLKDTQYYAMLTEWVAALTEAPIELSSEPFKSTEVLRKRRNATIHKSSAVASVGMAQSAIYTAVQGCIALYQHFGAAFPYHDALREYPLKDAPLFSEIDLPGVVSENGK